MKKVYTSPDAIKVNFETNDIITTSGADGVLAKTSFTDWNEVMTVSWNTLIGQ